MSVLGLFDIGKTTLLATRRALDTVGHNVANASTPGYSRQSVVLESIPAGVISDNGVSGRGVRVADVERMYDSLINLQLRSEKSQLSYYEAYEEASVKIESIFNEASENGIAPAITDFFNKWQEVASSPTGITQRTELLNSAEYLSTRISMAYSGLEDLRSEITTNNSTLASKVNTLTSQIGALNEKIASAPGSLDLQDQRDYLVEQLNQIVTVNTFEDTSGRYSVLLGGIPLVDGGTTYSLGINTATERFTITLGSEARDVNEYITGGELKANIELNESVISHAMTTLNILAINLTDQVNYYHKQGYSIESTPTTGNNFFDSLATVTDSSASGTITSSVISSASTYADNLNKRYRITYDLVGGTGYQQEGTSGIYWKVEESTDSGTTWSAISASSVALTSDTTTTPDYRALAFNGITVRIDGDQASLTSDTSGTFQLQFLANAAKEMSLNSSLTPQMVAAGQTSGLEGDNTNAKVIAGLIDSATIAGSTPIEFYRSFVSEIGSDVSTVKGNLKFQKVLVQELETRRQDTSGVSLDEEAANLMKFQKSFEAAARMISVADELLETLINMTGR